MSAPTNYISQIKAGSTTYDISALYLKNGNDFYSTQDILDLANISMQIVVVNSLPTASAETMGKLYLVSNSGSGTNIYDEYITTRSGSAGSYTYTWEKIGTTEADLSNYVTKGTYNLNVTGEYLYSECPNETDYEYDEGYETSISGTQAIPNHTHSVTAAGSISAVSTGTINYTPAGSIDLTGAGNASATFSGTKATINVKGQSNVTVGDHSYKPAGSVNVTPTAASKDTITYVTGVGYSSTPAFDGSETTLSHTITTATLTMSTAYTPAGSLSGTQAISGHTHTITPTTATFAAVSSWSAGSASIAASVMSSATVSNGVLSFETASQTFTAPSLSTSEKSAITTFSMASAGAVTVSGSNFSFSGTAATITVSGKPSVSVNDHVFTPAGNLEGLGLSVSTATAAFNTDAIKAVTAEFVGTSVSLAHTVTNNTVTFSGEYTPAGSVTTDAPEKGTYNLSGTGVRLVFTGSAVDSSADGGATVDGDNFTYWNMQHHRHLIEVSDRTYNVDFTTAEVYLGDNT